MLTTEELQSIPERLELGIANAPFNADFMLEMSRQAIGDNKLRMERLISNEATYQLSVIKGRALLSAMTEGKQIIEMILDIHVPDELEEITGNEVPNFIKQVQDRLMSVLSTWKFAYTFEEADNLMVKVWLNWGGRD